MPSKEIRDLGGLKLFEKFLGAVLKMDDASSLASPLFVLYDLRGMDSHLKSSTFDEKYNSCKMRLNYDRSKSHLDFFNAVITAILTMYEELNNRLEVDG